MPYSACWSTYSDHWTRIDSKCIKNDIYTPDTPCQIFVSWKPQTARTIQTNLTIKWRDEQAGANGKPVTVSISAMGIDTSLCGVCDDAPGGGSVTDQLRQKGRLVLGPDGKPKNKNPNINFKIPKNAG